MRWFSKGIALGLCLASAASAQTLGPPGGGGSGSPTGAAGGSLGGTYPNPTVTTNANLTGPITSIGNATSIASQTGTGTKFVVDTSPTLVTPNIGAATATSLSNPLYTAPGIFTFDSNGTTFAGNITAGQQWYLGTNNVAPPTGPILTVSKNVSTALAIGTPPGIAGTAQFIASIVGSDTAPADITVQAFGGNAPGFRFFESNGTAASPTSTASGDTLGAFDTYGYCSACSTPGYALGGAFAAVATEAWTSSHNGMKIQFFTVPTGTASLAVAATIGAGLMVGTATDPGAGSLQLNAQEFIPNATSDAGLTDATACLRSATGQILKGSGTLGICLGTSGAQFKTALVPMAAGLAEISKLDMLNYRYKSGFGDNGERIQYGLTAQQVATVMPDLVRYDEHGQAINFDIGALLPVALHAIQQLKADNDNLRACQQNWKCRIFGIN